MSRQRCFTSQAMCKNKDNGTSQQLTVNVTLKDLNREARRILRNSMVKDNLKKTRNEWEVYVSGPWFPCQDFQLTRRFLRKNSLTSGRVDDTRACSDRSVSSDLERYFHYSEKDELESAMESANCSTVIEDTAKSRNGSITPNPRFPRKELKVSFEDNYKQKTKGEAEKTSKKQENVKITRHIENLVSCASSVRKSNVLIDKSDDKKDGPIVNTEKRPSLDEMLEVLNQTEQNQVGPGENQVVKPNECSANHEIKIPMLSVSDLTDEQCSSKLPEEPPATNTIEVCLETLQRTRNDAFGDMKSLEGKGNQRRNSRSSRSPSSQLATSPLFQRRSSSSASSRNSASTKFSKNNQTSTTYLENISNPLLRESLNKILNPQSYMEDFEEAPQDKTSETMKLGRILFEEDQEFLLPNIKGSLKHSSQDVGNQRNRSSKYKSTVRFAENRRSFELSSTKCPGIVVHESHPVRMLSDGPEYAVKGLIGQWLKRRSGNTLARDKPNVEKQETYREVQLLKVGLSMRLLAGIG